MKLSCRDQTFWNDKNDKSACLPKSYARCPTGHALVLGSNKIDSTCVACSYGKWNDGLDMIDPLSGLSIASLQCRPWQNTFCPKGYGFVPGSTTADSKCELCTGETFQPNENSAKPCKSWTKGYFGKTDTELDELVENKGLTFGMNVAAYKLDKE